MNFPIKITDATLAKFDHAIILRGFIDPASIASLKLGDYHREHNPKHIRSTVKAFEGRFGVPPIEIGMRGHSFTRVGPDYHLQSDCYIIDGVLRTMAAMEILKSGKHPTLGVTIHFDTTEPWETERFKVLNTNRVAVSSNIFVRNQAYKNAAVKMLCDLNEDPGFVLKGRVSWDENLKHGQLIKGQALLKASCQLHRRLDPNLESRRYAEMTNGFLKALSQVGQVTLEENVKTFWQVIDECFNLRGLDVPNSVPYLKDGFLKGLAGFFSDHKDFWKGNKLTVSTYLRKKLALFPINDSTIGHLSGSSSWAAQTSFSYYLATHLNKGRPRTHHLTRFEATQFQGE